MNLTRRNLLASGMLALGGASPVLASVPPLKTKTAGGSETHRRRDPFAQLADQPAANLVHQTTTSTGSGNLVLAVVNGKRSFDSAFPHGSSPPIMFDYFVSHRTAAEWERGHGYMFDATTLVRDTVRESSNANALVNFSVGTKDVANAVPAQRLNTGFVDIRDYGVVQGNHGNITAALQAAINDFATHKCVRIRIPMVGDGIYRLDAVNFWTVHQPWIIEFDCTLVELAATLAPSDNMTLRGVRQWMTDYWLNAPFPAPQLLGLGGVSPSVDPVVKLRWSHCLLENLAIGAYWQGGIAVQIIDCSNSTIRQCVIGSDGVGSALEINNCFWITLDNIQCQGNLATNARRNWSIRFTCGTDQWNNVGLIRGKEIRLGRKGIRFDGGSIANVELVDVLCEGLITGESMIDIDSSTPGGVYQGIQQMEFKRVEIADAVGPGPWHTIKNIGVNTRGIIYEATNPGPDFFDPTSVPIQNFVLNNSLVFQNYGASLTPIYAGKRYQYNYRRDYAASIDAKLLTSPVGLPWTLGIPINVNQNPAAWTQRLSGATITPGLRAPDGSMMAGRVSGGGGALAYNQSMSCTVGDWFICGAWIRACDAAGVQTTQTLYNRVCNIKVGPWPSNVVNGNYWGPEPPTMFEEDNVPGDGWRWFAWGYKITSLGTNPATVTYEIANNGKTVECFNPCAMRIPAGTQGVDDAFILNLVRSLKGGWASGGLQGDVTLLDHQKLMIGGGVRIFSDDVSPATVSPPVTWKRGDVCYNNTPTVGQPKGWVCTVAGTPGTWVSMGNL